MTRLDFLLTAQRRRHRKAFVRATACAALAGMATVALLGVSGWFLAAAAGAGLAGMAAAQAFNYLLPSAAVRLLAIVRTGTRYGERLFGHDAALQSMAAVRPALFGAVCAAPVEASLALGRGEATTVLMQDVSAVEDQLVRRPAPWAAGAAMASGLALTAVAGWAPAASTAACGLLVLAGSRRLLRHRAESARAIRDATGALKDELALLAASAPELRCYGLEAWAAEHAAQHGALLVRAQRRHAADASRLDLLLAAATGCAAALAMWLARGQGAPLAALAGLSSAMALEGMAPLLRNGLQAAAAALACERLDALLASAGEPTALPDVGPGASLDLPLSLRGPLAAGARVAIVGPSGCGKTTLVETLLGLRPAVPGQIRLGGVDIARLSSTALRRHFAWLPQDACLLAGTVRENLALASHAASEAAMWRALDDAGLADRVRGCPLGLDAFVGEDGALFSGGERRRLALARAYLGDAPWLLLDEPTEGLDSETERMVLERLGARVNATGQGLLVVTHRAAVVACCDQVGRVADLVPEKVGGLRSAGV